MHATKDKPVVVNGEIVIRPIMVVALTYDHRLLDGREAVTFLGESLRACSAGLFVLFYGGWGLLWIAAFALCCGFVVVVMVVGAWLLCARIVFVGALYSVSVVFVVGYILYCLSLLLFPSQPRY
jgi:hypothetical protein